MLDDLVPQLSAALDGRYHIVRQIGEGGMATVFLADDVRHGRRVALKVLKPELAAVIGAERFLAEIKTTANLQHPHILPLFDSGEADGFLYYVMPYVEGESLRARLDREHQLPVDEAVRLATDVAEALDHAHSRGVIHRDIKPANILLQAGKPVVSDFGIAIAVGAAGGGRLTETGLSLGTPRYMSPEQATGDTSVGPATDIYALGCVLYEMLVGEPPYTGSTVQAILGKIIQAAPVSATAARRPVPAHVDAAIRKALEKLPADRFTGAGRFAAALSETHFRHGPDADGVVAQAAPAGWRRMALGLGALSALLAAGLVWALFRPAPPAAVVRSALWLPEGLEIETTGGAGFALSPDGSHVVFAATAAGVTRLWQRPLDELDLTLLPGTEGARTPVYSPDGTAVAFISAGRLMVVSLTGAPPLTLVGEGIAGGASGLSWSRDGWLYFRRAGESGLRRVRADVGGVGEVATNGSGQDLHPDAIPGGRALLFSRNRTGSDPEIFLRDLERGDERRLFDGSTARYASSGHVVFTSVDGTLLAAPFDARRLEVVGPPRPLFGGVETAPLAGSHFALSRSGTLLYREGAATGGVALVEVDLAGNERVLPLPPRDISPRGPTWSPDGESIVFSSQLQIYTYDTRLNTTPRQVTFEGTNISPVFSPDGRRIAFSSFRDGTRGIDVFVKDLTSDAPARSVLAAEGAQFVMQWPTDTLLVFESALAPGTRELWSLDLSDPDRPEAKLYLSSEASISDIAVSPDGRLAAYRSDESGSEEVYVRSFPDPGEPTVVSRGGGGIPFWSPDATTLFYATRVGRVFMAARLERTPLPRVVSVDTLFAEPYIATQPMPGATLHPDGDRFIFAVLPDAPGEGVGTRGPGRVILVQGFHEELRRLAPAN